MRDGVRLSKQDLEKQLCAAIHTRIAVSNCFPKTFTNGPQNHYNDDAAAVHSNQAQPYKETPLVRPFSMLKRKQSSKLIITLLSLHEELPCLNIYHKI